ncbi:MAG: hypothetical protein ACUVXI_01355 [bacterium]
MNVKFAGRLEEITSRFPPRDVKSILLMRSCPRDKFLEVLDRLRESYPSAHIAVLSTRGEGAGDEVIALETSRFSPALRSLRRLRGRRFDLVVVIYNNYTGDTYLNVELLASLIGARHRIGCNSSNLYVTITPQFLLCRLGRIALWFLGTSFVLACAIIFCGMFRVLASLGIVKDRSIDVRSGDCHNLSCGR